MYWLFQTKKFSAFSQLPEEKLIWEQKANFRGRVGDEILMLRETTFISVYSIQNIDINEGNQTEKKTITIDIKLVNKYSDEKELKDYIYSFPRIKYFDKKTYRHFTRKYYRLGKIEFNAVNDDEIFISRSIIGGIINSMHIDHRKAFVKFLAEKDPEFISNNIDYQIVAKYLYSYLNFAIVEPARNFQIAGNILRGIIGEEAFAEAGFSNENKISKTNKVELIGAQLLMIEGNLENLNLLGNNGNGLSEQIFDETQQRGFNNLFAGKKLPIEF